MKRFLLLFAALLFAAFALASCSGGEGTTTTTTTTASCAHDFSEWVTLKDPTCTEEGVKVHYCKLCQIGNFEPIATNNTHKDANDDHQCDLCHTTVSYSDGLAYVLSENGQYYIVSGKGTCTDADIIIPSWHNGLPVTEIGIGAFWGEEGIKSVFIPASITSTSEAVLIGCQDLTHIYVDENSDYFKSVDGVLYTKDGKSILAYPFAKEAETFSIPQGVETIAPGAFAGSKLTAIDIPNSVTSIGDAAFTWCISLTSVTIPDSVISIGNNAFESCSSLTSVTLGNNVTTIGQYAFYKCTSLTSIEIPDSVTSIGDGAFDFKPIFTITFEGADVAPIKVPLYTSATAPTAPTKAGYIFAGWTYAGEAWDWENIVISDITLTASWIAIEYPLNLNLAGGVLVNAPTFYTIEGLTLPVPTKAGFAFAGWLNANGNPVANVAAGTTGALTFTATWTETVDFSVDFQNTAQNIHYAEPNSSFVAITYGQTYNGGQGSRTEGTIQPTYSSDLSFANGEVMGFFKSAKNWHEMVKENNNRFFKVTLDQSMVQPKYETFTKNEAYNVGLQFYPGSKLDVTDNVFTISFDFRQKNVGAFGINVYARGNGRTSYGQNRSNLVMIDTDGSLWINKDTINDAREAYTDGSDKLAETKIGQTTVGEWNTIKIVMTELEDGGHLVDIYCNGTKLTDVSLFLNDPMRWGADNNAYTNFMIYGGAQAGQAAAEAIPGYYNEYDFDNISVNGFYAEVE